MTIFGGLRLLWIYFIIIIIFFFFFLGGGVGGGGGGGGGDTSHFDYFYGFFLLNQINYCLYSVVKLTLSHTTTVIKYTGQGI